MSTFAFVFLCIQACLVQNVFSQCLGAYGPAIAPAALSPAASCGYGAGLGGLAYPGVGFAGAGIAGLAYPGAGFGGLAYPAAGFTGTGLAGLDYPGAGFGGLAYPAAGFAGAYPGTGLAPYGGAGEGNVAVAGELPVAGTTAVAGQVPIMGAVSFSGPVAAAGTVSIIGQCACGCGASNGYLY